VPEGGGLEHFPGSAKNRHPYHFKISNLQRQIRKAPVRFPRRQRSGTNSEIEASMSAAPTCARTGVVDGRNVTAVDGMSRATYRNSTAIADARTDICCNSTQSRAGSPWTSNRDAGTSRKQFRLRASDDRTVVFHLSESKATQDLGKPPCSTPLPLPGVYCAHEEGSCCHK
jgi:hypothetical protein